MRFVIRNLPFLHISIYIWIFPYDYCYQGFLLFLLFQNFLKRLYLSDKWIQILQKEIRNASRTNKLYSFLGFVNLIFQHSDMSKTETRVFEKIFSVFFPKSWIAKRSICHRYNFILISITYYSKALESWQFIFFSTEKTQGLRWFLSHTTQNMLSDWKTHWLLSMKCQFEKLAIIQEGCPYWYLVEKTIYA